MKKSHLPFNVNIERQMAVWQSDNNFTIHDDGSWTTRSVGPSGDQPIDVEVINYDETTSTLNLVTNDKYTQIHIQNDKEIIVDLGESGGSSTFILIE